MRLNSASVGIGRELQAVQVPTNREGSFIILPKAPHVIRIHFLLHDAFFHSLQAKLWAFLNFVAPKTNHRLAEVIQQPINLIVASHVALNLLLPEIPSLATPYMLPLT